ncbi:hypothetical protein WMO13_01880 [Ignatzschineria larvae DSM 13226]|uniref:PH domain-containing protein n=1 Tax=Ignatzschineria larvae DSM 13226 TaxID=1111732 RepID=A0ABZ3C036_9GAMM|nr:hypothetical protein [Ignatzschineria larvae]
MEEKVYTISSKAKTNLILMIVFAVVAIVVIEQLLVGRVPVLLFILLGIFFYITSVSTATLKRDRLVVKPILGRAREFTFHDGTFAIDKQQGISAMVMLFKKEAECLTYSPIGQDPVMAMNGLYDIAVIESIYNDIKARQDEIGREIEAEADSESKSVPDNETALPNSTEKGHIENSDIEEDAVGDASEKETAQVADSTEEKEADHSHPIDNNATQDASDQSRRS